MIHSINFHSIDWLQVIRVAVFIVVTIAAYALLVLWIAREVGNASDRQMADYNAWLDEERKRKLARLLQIADEVEAAPEHERQRLYREADALGFINQVDDPPTPQRAA